MDSVHVTTSFRYDILCVLILITPKIQIVYGHSTYRMTALLQRCLCSVLELDMRYDWQVMAPNTHHNLKTTGHVWMFCMSNNYYQEHSLCGCWVAWEILLESYGPIHTLVALIQHCMCAYTSSPYKHHYLVCNYAWQQNSCTVPYDCILHTKQRPYCQGCIIL